LDQGGGLLVLPLFALFMPLLAVGQAFEQVGELLGVAFAFLLDLSKRQLERCELRVLSP
jgi:hypothetical protein